MTLSEVEAAVEYVLGERVYQALRDNGVSLPEKLNMAALKAFREGWPDERNNHLNKIRGALMMLARDGFFTFDPENT